MNAIIKLIVKDSKVIDIIDIPKDMTDAQLQILLNDTAENFGDTLQAEKNIEMANDLIRK